jgi:hypothetical protein
LRRARHLPRCASLEEARAQVDAIGQQKQGYQKPSSAKKRDLLQDVDFLGGVKGTGQHLYNRGHGDLLPHFDTYRPALLAILELVRLVPHISRATNAPGAKPNVPEALARRLQVTLFFA